MVLEQRSGVIFITFHPEGRMNVCSRFQINLCIKTEDVNLAVAHRKCQGMTKVRGVPPPLIDPTIQCKNNIADKTRCSV